MAKINLTTQHNQENLGALASLGVLICMIVTLVGIKLWWFKHRLSFEQTSSTPSSSNSTTPPVIVPRRSKQPKYKKDKRYSQQIYESVEIHGVFRQKREDELEINRPVQLPPVRIRQSSESASSLVLPPPRAKRRDQVHSTAFEDLEVITPPTPLATASSSDLFTIPENNKKLSITFEEFQRQFNLKEIKPELTESNNTKNEVGEIPVPPLRLKRSTSSMGKPEKPQRILKSSQSITIPEFHKIVEKRSPSGLSSPKEDLTKIDLEEQAKIFKDFREPEAVAGGYIKYEEVDSDLQENELNAAVGKQDLKFYERSEPLETALKALRNERIIYNNNLNESPDAQFTEEYDFSRKAYLNDKWLEVDFKEENFKRDVSGISQMKYELSDCIFDGNTEGKLTKLQNDSTSLEKNFVTEAKAFTSEQILKETARENPRDGEKLKVKETGMDCFATHGYQNSRIHVSETLEGTSPSLSGTDSRKHHIKEIGIHNKNNEIKGSQAYDEYDGHNLFVDKEKSQEILQISAPPIVPNESFNSLAESWPQFDEKIETPQVTVRRFNSRDLKAQDSFDENDGLSFENKMFPSMPTKPNSYARNCSNSPELPDVVEWQQTFNNKFYNQVRSFMRAESSHNSQQYGVTFDSSEADQCANENNKNSLIRQRRPTGYIRHEESFSSPNDAPNEDIENIFQSNEDKVQLSKVTFEESYTNGGWESDTEKFTLNRRRPTGFIKFNNNEESEEIDERQIKFDQATVFKEAEEFEDSIIKQRRPTGFIRSISKKVSSDSLAVQYIETENKFENYKNSSDPLVNSNETPDGSSVTPSFQFLKKEKMSEDNETKTGSLIKQSSEDLTNSSLDHFVETEKSSTDFFTTTESWTGPRRPTGYVNPDNFLNSPLDQFLETEKSSENYENKNEIISPSVHFAEIENKNEHDGTHNESLIKQRTPTGYVRPITSINSPSAQLLEIETSSKDYEIKNESLLNQRRPTGYLPHAPSVRFMETEQSFDDYENHNESAIKQRRPTGYARPPDSPNSPSADYPAKNESLLNQKSPEVVPDSPSVRFAEPEKSCEDFESTNESLIKQRRPTGYNRPEISYDSNDNETNRESKFKQRRATTPEANNVTFIKSEKTFEHSEYQAKSLVKQRRPTGYIHQAELYDLEKQVSFQLDTENNENRAQYNEALQQRRPTGFIRKEEINKQVNFALNEKHESDKKKDNEKLRQRRPTGLIKNTLTDSEFDNNLWQELEKDVAQDFSRNFEAEFAKIRHSYELNEADFLELKDELQKSPSADVVKQPLGFGKSIEDDWENFEKLKNQVVIKPLQSPETEIKITFSDNDLANTISILKDKKLEEELQAKPRKSKVTFDFKTEEHVIPARKSHYDAEDNTDNEEDEKVVPPQPIKRVSNINYNNELPTTIKTPTSITLFGSQANSEEDSWSLIRKHRNLTSDWQNSSPESSQTLSSPKPTYRNPMAQLAIQRAKEVRGDMDGFKARSINNRKPEATKRQKQKLFYLNKDDNFEGTEA